MIIEILKLSSLFSLGIIGAFITLGLLIGWIEGISNRTIQLRFGRKAVIVTGIIGTTIHEFSHYIMCKLFGHKVNSVKWFSISANESSELGYVSHSYNKKNIYQRVGNFFIGVAPIVVGTVILVACFYILMPENFNDIYSRINIKEYVLDSNDFNIKGFFYVLFSNLTIIVKKIFVAKNLINIRFWIYLFIAVSISTHMSLSKADLKNSIDGIFAIVILSVIGSIIAITLNFNIDSIIHNLLILNCIVISFISIGVLFSVVALIIIKIICAIKI
ncbi:DUF3267 domain-containing protein [Clostridium gasigenes]|uniref:metalloprotease family protein n=1 Tax=Clostridium gasigenes TaxID=94869 RepID=UPI001C0B0AB7|nr:metalloprotease family protein [Clostridium gasigenes]MBU3135242.1 DUF3267 domain-containing protein [Clostridium gasigenes]